MRGEMSEPQYDVIVEKGKEGVDVKLPANLLVGSKEMEITWGVNVAVTASRINIIAASRKMRREFPEKRAINPTKGRILRGFEEAF